MYLSDHSEVVYPIVPLEVNSVKTRALLDTAAEGWYTSLRLIDALQERPMEIKTKRVHMYMANVHALDVLTIATYSHRT